MRFPAITVKQAVRRWEERANRPLTAEQYEQDAELNFREARRTGNPVFEAHARFAKLHAERTRRGLVTITDLPAEVLRRWEFERASALYDAHLPR